MSELMERLNRWLNLAKQALSKDDPRFDDALSQTDWQGNAYGDSPFEQLAEAVRAVLEDIKAEPKIPKETVWFPLELTEDEKQYLIENIKQLQDSIDAKVAKGMKVSDALIETAKEMLSKRK